jgi:hypothetical protein
MTARFAPGDYIVAAQNPLGLLAQAMEALGSTLNTQGYATAGAGPKFSMQEPALNAMTGAILNALDRAGSATTEKFDITVQANGETLDRVLFQSERKGKAPRMKQHLRKSNLRAGVHVGFNRGKYNSRS